MVFTMRAVASALDLIRVMASASCCMASSPSTAVLRDCSARTRPSRTCEALACAMLVSSCRLAATSSREAAWCDAPSLSDALASLSATEAEDFTDGAMHDLHGRLQFFERRIEVLLDFGVATGIGAVQAYREIALGQTRQCGTDVVEETHRLALEDRLDPFLAGVGERGDDDGDIHLQQAIEGTLETTQLRGRGASILYGNEHVLADDLVHRHVPVRIEIDAFVHLTHELPVRDIRIVHDTAEHGQQIAGDQRSLTIHRRMSVENGLRGSRTGDVRIEIVDHRIARRATDRFPRLHHAEIGIGQFQESEALQHIGV